MYTQCPDCGTAFRVTAEILKQAAGKVRCGGCGNAFDALEYLSEDKPGPLANSQAEESLPELKPDPGELEDAAVPKSISAKQSAALLKTLDELAGSDIRIEDTGAEWRVVDEKDEVDNGAEPDEKLSPDDTGSIRWFIDDSPTPVDEQLSAEPGEIDAPEIFEEATAGEQMRFDDDTPLPDDFDFDAEPPEQPEPTLESRADPSELEAEQVDLALGEPEDWEDLLEEVDEPPPAPAETAAVEESDDGAPAAVAPEDDEETSRPPESDDARPLPDVDAQFATQAEAMGIDLSGMHARLQNTPDETRESPQTEDGETSIEDDLVAAAFEVEAEARAKRAATQHDADEVRGDETVIESSDDDEVAEDEIAAVSASDDESLEDVIADEAPRDDEPDAADLAGVDSEERAQTRQDEEFEIDLDFDEEDLIEARDRELLSSTEEDAKLAAELGLDDSEAESEPEKPEPVFLPESEEEKTVNMMIDQDLLAIAVEDEDGFASTIVQKQSDEKSSEDDAAEKSDETPTDDPLVETIIMEGDFIRDAEKEGQEDEQAKALDPDLKSAAAADLKGLPEGRVEAARQPASPGMIAGIAALLIVLFAQVAHQMRESLVTLPAIGGPVGSFYRAIGRPVTPDWDISGWRFEATKGSTDEDDAVLTIYSRVGNKSAEALPYPLISVSLTDRYEDIIGSRVLEPGEYLAGNLDARRGVAPGDTFSAVISIEAPSAEATGFKLNVCYRQAGGKLKCAVDDFK